MAHLVQQMAYVGATPWHELGSQLPAKQPIEVWAREAGMDWTIRETPVRFAQSSSVTWSRARSIDPARSVHSAYAPIPSGGGLRSQSLGRLA